MIRMTLALARLLVADREDKNETAAPRRTDSAEPTGTVRVPQQRRGGGPQLRTSPRTGARLTNR